MSGNVENLILEHLKTLRNELRDAKPTIQADLRDIKARLSDIESHQVALWHPDAKTPCNQH